MTNALRWVAILLAGCQGAIGDALPVADDVTRPPDDPGLTAGESRLRSLNQREYTNTVRDLFGLDALGPLELPADFRNGRGFDTDGDTAILTEAAAEQWLVAAETIAIETRARGIDELATCESAAPAELHACLEPHYEAWLEKAFRSPPEPESIERLRSLVATADTYADAIEVVTIFTLVSPHFLFHYKTPAGAPELDGFEIADRLAYMLWATLPDEALLDAARDGSLLDPETRLAHAERMLDDPRSERFVDAFLGLWLNIDRLPSRAESDEEAALLGDMVRETMTFAADALANGAIADLLTAEHSFLNARMATHYGLADAGLDDQTFVRRVLPRERQGILTHASLLAARSPESISDPIRRGVWTAVEFLCVAPDIPPPPDVGALELASGGETPREVLARHQEDPVCASCHAHTDPYGLAMETFDALGAYREVYDNGRTVDPSGELPTGERFADLYELIGLVAERRTLEHCMTEHLATYGLGRTLDSQEIAAVSEAVEARTALVAAPRLRDLVRGIVGSPLFVTKGGMP
jgi:hypothetical protein